MNELIKQIAEKHKMVYQIPGGNLTTCHPNLEDFAKAIIEECVLAINEDHHVLPSAGSIMGRFGLSHMERGI